jgi:hypothetical protein
VKVNSEEQNFLTRRGFCAYSKAEAFNYRWPTTTKQLEVYAVQEGEDWLVITVIARYF